jgi:hypothetical protein
LKSGLLGASASGAILVAGVGAFGFACVDAGLGLGGCFATGGTLPIGAICACAAPSAEPARTPVNSNARQPRDIEPNLFISNENPSMHRPLQRSARGRQSRWRHSG